MPRYSCSNISLLREKTLNKYVHRRTLVHRWVSARSLTLPPRELPTGFLSGMTVFRALHKFTSASLKVSFPQKAGSIAVSGTFFLSVLVPFHFAKTLFRAFPRSCLSWPRKVVKVLICFWCWMSPHSTFFFFSKALCNILWDTKVTITTSPLHTDLQVENFQGRECAFPRSHAWMALKPTLFHSPRACSLSSATPPSSSHWLGASPACPQLTVLHCLSRHCTVRWKTPYFLCLFIIYYLWEKYYKPIAVQYYIADCVRCVSRLILLDLGKNWTCEYTLGTEFVHMEETHCILSFKSSRNCYTAAIFLCL